MVLEMLSAGQYLVAVAEIAVIAASLGFGALRFRSRLLPGWSGPPARLAELVGGAALLVWAMELLGGVGLLTEAGLIGMSVVLGVGVGVAAGRARPRPAPPQRPPFRQPSQLATGIAVLVVAGLFAQWAGRAYPSLLYGSYGFDGLWYHMPFAARFAQLGSLNELHFTSPALLTWFYPANSELFHTAGILVTGRDFLSPLVNLGWLGAALLAAWCLGRPWGAGPGTVVGAAAVLAAGVFADQAGEGRNDVPATFFLLAAAALLANASTTRTDRYLPAAWPPLALAGVAAGLAVGTKLNLLAPVAALTLGVMIASPRGRRLASSTTWIAALLAGGGFWYLRNLLQVGNALPWISSLGPISLPGPDGYLGATREPHALIRYAGDTDVWREWLLPALGERFGTLWPGLVLIALLGVVVAIVRGRSIVERVLGWMVAAAALAYPFTPLSASGPEGMPLGFGSNLRYLAPVIALALGLLPIAVARLERRWRAAALAVLVVLAGSAALRARDVVTIASPRAAAITGVAALALLVIAWAYRTDRLPRRTLAPALAMLAVLAVALGYQEQRTYLDGRYATRAGGNAEDSAFIWARNLHDQRIATVIARQYPLYGLDLSNRVDYVGVHGPVGAFSPVGGCHEWREAINFGSYDYVVTGFREPTEELGDRPKQPPEAEWTRTDPATTEIIHDHAVSVFKVNGELDPDLCGRKS